MKNTKVYNNHTSKQPRVCMIVFSYYPSDPRVRREAEALIDEGYQVDIICLKKEGQATQESIYDVRVYRLPIQRKRGNKFRYLWEYATFILLSMLKAAVLHIRKKYQVVHVHNMPDILVFSALIPKLSGAKIVLDLHDPMPEVYMTKYNINHSHPIIRTLLALEKKSISFANFVLTPNIAFRDLFLSRSCTPDKIAVLMNTPDEKIFSPTNGKSNSSSGNSNGFTLMYHGTVVERHGLGTALEAISLLRDQVPDLKFHVYGEGDYVAPFLQKVEELRLQPYVKYHGFVSMEEIAAALPKATVGIIPNLKTPFTEINMPTRIFEYLSMDKPVVVPKTEGITDYFDENSLFYFESGNPESLADTLLRVCQDGPVIKETLDRGKDIYQQHSWEVEQKKLLKTYQSLLS